MKLRLLLLSIFVVIWLVPFYWSGSMMNLPVRVYSRLGLQYTAAGLFTRRVPSWNQTHIQVQSKGATDWKTIETTEISPMGVFGFRQRVDRIAQDMHKNQPVAEKIQQRLAEWIAREYAKQHPNEGEMTGVRMGQTTWAANTPEMAAPAGEWVRDPVDLKPTTPFRAYASYTISQGKAQLERVTTVPAAARTPAVFQRKTETPTPKPSTPQR